MIKRDLDFETFRLGTSLDVSPTAPAFYAACAIMAVNLSRSAQQMCCQTDSDSDESSLANND